MAGGMGGKRAGLAMLPKKEKIKWKEDVPFFKRLFIVLFRKEEITFPDLKKRNLIDLLKEEEVWLPKKLKKEMRLGLKLDPSIRVFFISPNFFVLGK